MNEFDAVGPVCIVTANGIICMESPLKWHRSYRYDCVVEEDPHNEEKTRARSELIAAIRNAISKSSLDLGRSEDADSVRTHIAAMAVFMLEAARCFPAAHFDPASPFTLVKGVKPSA